MNFFKRLSTEFASQTSRVKPDNDTVFYCRFPTLDSLSFDRIYFLLYFLSRSKKMNGALVIYIHGKGGNAGEEAANRKNVS